MSAMKHFEENDYGQRKENGLTLSTEEDCDDESDCLAEILDCINLYKRDSTKREVSWEKYGQWRQEQKNRAARLEKQLKARWELEELIEEQLSSFHAHYNRAMVPNRLKDISQILMPKWAPTYELAAMSWLGDWRPSAILDLVRVLVRSSTSLPSSSSSPSSFCGSDSPGAEQLLSQLINDIRIEETIIDEEMAEIQATCILHLPFGPMNIKPGGAGALTCVQSVFKNIERVITKAQKLRFKALELVLKKVLSPIDAAEFLVAFEEIQDTIHQFAVNHRQEKGPVSVVPFKAS
ncbi:protein DOG1-like 3 [Humulus lupulus]|uniref:protein DOG1-like 3 n=1 Tax=Humulus lupulus TaxID=3486 RepID=UPI002B408258|nr:protein DOG1-like 3 [Humulus lupulus]